MGRPQVSTSDLRGEIAVAWPARDAECLGDRCAHCGTQHDVVSNGARDRNLDDRSDGNVHTRSRGAAGAMRRCLAMLSRPGARKMREISSDSCAGEVEWWWSFTTCSAALVLVSLVFGLCELRAASHLRRRHCAHEDCPCCALFPLSISNLFCRPIYCNSLPALIVIRCFGRSRTLVRQLQRAFPSALHTKAPKRALRQVIYW